MWEVAIVRILILLLQAGKSYAGSLIKLSRSIQFRLYFIKKDIIRGISDW